MVVCSTKLVVSLPSRRALSSWVFAMLVSVGILLASIAGAGPAVSGFYSLVLLLVAETTNLKKILGLAAILSIFVLIPIFDAPGSYVEPGAQLLVCASIASIVVSARLIQKAKVALAENGSDRAIHERVREARMLLDALQISANAGRLWLEGDVPNVTAARQTFDRMKRDAQVALQAIECITGAPGEATITRSVTRREHLHR